MRRRDFGIMVAPSVAVMLLLLTVPLVYTVIWSLQRVDYTGGGEWIGLDNYGTALSDPAFRTAVSFTIGFTIANTVMVIVLGYGLALLLGRARRARSAFIGFLLVPYVLPGVIAATAFSWLFDDNFGGLVNFFLEKLTGERVLWFTSTWPNRSMIFVEALWAGAPFVMLVMFAALKTVPQDLVDAATVDGAKWWQRQRFVVIPTLGPMFRFLALISVMDGLRLFDALVPLAPNAESIGTQSVNFYVFRQAFSRSDQNLGLGSAVNVMMMLVMIVLIVPLVRQIYREVGGVRAR